MTISVRLPKDAEELLARLARRRGLSKSQILREALASFVAREGGPEVRPFAAVSHLIGCADSGGRQLSEQTGERFRALLRVRRQ